MPDEISARVSVVETRLSDHISSDGYALLSTRVNKLESVIAELRGDVRVLRAQVTVYAALGAFLGGVAMQILVHFLFRS